MKAVSYFKTSGINNPAKGKGLHATRHAGTQGVQSYSSTHS